MSDFFLWYLKRKTEGVFNILKALDVPRLTAVRSWVLYASHPLKNEVVCVVILSFTIDFIFFHHILRLDHTHTTDPHLLLA